MTTTVLPKRETLRLLHLSAAASNFPILSDKLRSFRSPGPTQPPLNLMGSLVQATGQTVGRWTLQSPMTSPLDVQPGPACILKERNNRKDPLQGCSTSRVVRVLQDLTLHGTTAKQMDAVDPSAPPQGGGKQLYKQNVKEQRQRATVRLVEREKEEAEKTAPDCTGPGPSEDISCRAPTCP